MENVKETIAKNLTELRKAHKLTQGTLAEKLNYSDKAVSRWEHAETLPDIETLCKICDIYGVSFEYLLKQDNTQIPIKPSPKRNRAREVILCLITICTVWLAAILLFTTVKALFDVNLWQIFIWAVPATITTVGICNRMWWRSKVCLALTSSFNTWTIIFAIYLQAIAHNLWMLFIIGVPIQALILLSITMPEKKD